MGLRKDTGTEKGRTFLSGKTVKLIAAEGINRHENND